MDDERPPICPTCGVTMVPAELSAVDELDPVDGLDLGDEPDAVDEFAADRERGVDWVCLECEETGAALSWL